MTLKIKTTHTRSCKGEEQYWCQEMRWVPGCRVEEAIHNAQAEQRRKDAEIARSGWKKMSKHFHSPHTVCREIADAILAQEDGDLGALG